MLCVLVVVFLLSSTDNPFAIPAVVAQIIAFFVDHKDCAIDAEFFARPQGPEWEQFLLEFLSTVQRVGTFDFAPDLEPHLVMGLLHYVLSNFLDPVIPFTAFNTLFGDPAVGLISQV